jgi:hypothetical protein
MRLQPRDSLDADRGLCPLKMSPVQPHEPADHTVGPPKW